jgi:hypothetical protein
MYISKEVERFASKMYKYGYNKIAMEILSYVSPIYKGQPGTAAPVMQLSSLIDKIENSPLFSKLPESVIRGLMKVKKMTTDPFKYASNKESFFGFGHKGTYIEEVKKYLEKLEDKINFAAVPEDVYSAYIRLKGVINKHLSGKEEGNKIKKEEEIKGIKENKGENKGVEKKEVGKREETRGIEEDTEQLKALRALKRSLSKSNLYKNIYYKLPAVIIKELEKIGLGIDDLPIIKTANIDKVIDNYFDKEAMELSGIKGVREEYKLNDREIARALRLAIAAELDAIHLYELIVDSTPEDDNVKKLLHSIANEEKVHVGELQKLLELYDWDNKELLKEGEEEATELLKLKDKK